jgi:hypothetical protein
MDKSGKIPSFVMVYIPFIVTIPILVGYIPMMVGH